MSVGTRIGIAETDADISRCFPVMRQLRLHLKEAEFVPPIRLQQRDGFRLAFLEDGGEVVATAGFRVIENLSAGRVLHVDDLVTDGELRSRGYGRGTFRLGRR